MPTYDFKCGKCDNIRSFLMSMGEYSRNPPKPQCCDTAMDRHLSVVPAMSGLANALAGDRHYDGLRAPDGTDISTRTKHREYMRANNLTLADDFKQTWASHQRQREAFAQGQHTDRELRSTLTEQVHKAMES